MNIKREPEELEQDYSSIDWTKVRGSVVSYALVLRIPFEQIANLEQALAVMPNVKVAYRKTSVGHLYISDSPKDAPAEREGGRKDAEKEEGNRSS